MKQQFRQRISEYLLQQEIKKSHRKPTVIPFGNVRSIGILYDGTHDKDYDTIKNYVKDLRALSKDVHSLGYLDQKELPDSRYMKLGLDFFTRKCLNWKLKPNNAIVSNFINKDFDILICLSPDKSIPLRYVSALTKAKLKIGKYDVKNSGIYDFMIKLEGQPGLRHMIDQVNHYINLLKNEKYQEA